MAGCFLLNRPAYLVASQGTVALAVHAGHDEVIGAGIKVRDHLLVGCPAAPLVQQEVGAAAGPAVPYLVARDVGRARRPGSTEFMSLPFCFSPASLRFAL